MKRKMCTGVVCLKDECAGTGRANVAQCASLRKIAARQESVIYHGRRGRKSTRRQLCAASLILIATATTAEGLHSWNRHVL